MTTTTTKKKSTTTKPENKDDTTTKSNERKKKNTLSKVDQYNDLMCYMSKTKDNWDKEEEEKEESQNDSNKKNIKRDKNDDIRDRLLSNAIEMALEQGRGWNDGEKEEYLTKILDDDYIPPLFATCNEDVHDSGLEEAFTTLIYDEPPSILMKQFQKKGNDTYQDGTRNVTGNLSYYRTAINHYYEAIAWSEKVIPMNDGDMKQADTDELTYTQKELDSLKSTLYSNIGMCHIQLKNWGYVRDTCIKAIELDPNHNMKAYYRLAKSYMALHQYELANNIIDNAIEKIDNTNTNTNTKTTTNADIMIMQKKELYKLQKQITKHVQQERKQRQQRERKRAQRLVHIKRVWKHCNNHHHHHHHNNSGSQKNNNIIRLGRVPLVARTSDDDDDEYQYNDHDGNSSSNERIESIWNSHLPYSGLLPNIVVAASHSHSHNNGNTDVTTTTTATTWPVLFLYPSHHQSDFIKDFSEHDMFAIRMANMFPEIEDDHITNYNNVANKTTSIPWDYNNEFVCSQLAVYFEVHNNNINNDEKDKMMNIIHPDHDIELINDQASCIKLYEHTRALKGDEGDDIATIVRIQEQKRLLHMRKRYKQKYGSLYYYSDDNNGSSSSRKRKKPIVRVHPAMTLRDVLTDTRMIVPNFLPTFVLFPENHPLHIQYIKEHQCIGILQPKQE